tara:strand:+ start:4503 stop:5291 length:789 start_codon:yes stop_codon:yes gene_type:complete
MIDIPKALEERYGKSHLSYSSLKVALDDIAKFDLYMKRDLKFESPALEFGTMYDMMLFEPEKASDVYVPISDETIIGSCSASVISMKKPKLSSEFRERKSDLIEKAESEGKKLVSQEDWSQAKDMITRLEVCGLADQYLSSGNYQVEFNEMLGPIRVKGFLDCLGDGYIVDSKSTKSISKFRYSVRDFSYDIQAYIYTKVFGVDEFYWLVQEKTSPYLPAIVECSEETLFAGEMKFNDAIERIERFLREGSSPVQDYLRFKV